MSKKIKIECEGAGWGTKISVDGKDLLKDLGIYGVELSIFADGVTELTLHQKGEPVVFDGKAKIIKVFGEEEYVLVDKEYVNELKGKMRELEKENQELHKLIKK